MPFSGWVGHRRKYCQVTGGLISRDSRNLLLYGFNQCVGHVSTSQATHKSQNGRSKTYYTDINRKSATFNHPIRERVLKTDISVTSQPTQQFQGLVDLP